MPKLTIPTSRPLRRAVVAGAFLGSAVAALLVCSTALALWSKVVSAGPQTLSTLALGPPSGLSAAPSGHGVSLAWTAGTNGSGYAVKGVANGSSSNCAAASFVAVGTAATTSYSDSLRFTPEGTYFCYQVLTSRGNWTSPSGNPTAAAQLGFVAATAVAADGGTGGKLATGDTITFAFNQPVSTASGPSGTNSVCAIFGSTIVVGAIATSGACSATEANNLGTLTGGSTNKAARFNATWAWSNSNKTLTVTIGGATVGSAPTLTGSWTFTPTSTSSKLLSSTGSFHICDTNTGGGSCLPAVSGSF